MQEHVRVEPLGRGLKISLGGGVIVETERALVVREVGSPDRYYVPREDVRAQLSDGSGEGRCPWKGRWRHLDVEAGSRRVASGAWTYFETTPACAAIQGYVAFYGDRMDGVEVR